MLHLSPEVRSPYRVRRLEILSVRTNAVIDERMDVVARHHRTLVADEVSRVVLTQVLVPPERAMRE
jgi:hypothetical protein